MEDQTRPIVVIVDDEVDIVSIISAGLRLRGVPSLRAASAEEARALVVDEPRVAVVVADINMPGQSGLDLAADLNANRPENRALEFIFMTGNGTKETVTQALRQGAFDFIDKPFEVKSLIKRVEDAMARCSERRVRARRVATIDAEIASARTERQKLVSELSRSQTMLDRVKETRTQLFSVISHELRTPLIPVIGLSSMMMEDADITIDEARDFAGIIHASGTELLSLIDTVLEVLELDQKDHVLRPQQTSLAQTIQHAAKLAAESLGEQAVDVDVVSETDFTAHIEPQRMERALAALLNNAMRASPPNGRVRVEFGVAEHGQAFVSVADDGDGIPASVLTQIGNPFLQADLTSTRAWPGIGMGLCFATLVARLHGGALSVSSSATSGTVATLSWPTAL